MRKILRSIKILIMILVAHGLQLILLLKVLDRTRCILLLLREENSIHLLKDIVGKM